MIIIGKNVIVVKSGTKNYNILINYINYFLMLLYGYDDNFISFLGLLSIIVDFLFNKLEMLVGLIVETNCVFLYDSFHSISYSIVFVLKFYFFILIFFLIGIQNMLVGHVIHFFVQHVMMVIVDPKKLNEEIHQNIQHF